MQQRTHSLGRRGRNSKKGRKIRGDKQKGVQRRWTKTTSFAFGRGKNSVGHESQEAWKQVATKTFNAQRSCFRWWSINFSAATPLMLLAHFRNMDEVMIQPTRAAGHPSTAEFIIKGSMEALLQRVLTSYDVSRHSIISYFIDIFLLLPFSKRGWSENSLQSRRRINLNWRVLTATDFILEYLIRSRRMMIRYLSCIFE